MNLKNSQGTIQPHIITQELISNIFYTGDKLSVLYKVAAALKIKFEFQMTDKLESASFIFYPKQER